MKSLSFSLLSLSTEAFHNLPSSACIHSCHTQHPLDLCVGNPRATLKQASIHSKTSFQLCPRGQDKPHYWHQHPFELLCETYFFLYVSKLTLNSEFWLPLSTHTHTETHFSTHVRTLKINLGLGESSGSLSTSFQ